MRLRGHAGRKAEGEGSNEDQKSHGEMPPGEQAEGNCAGEQGPRHSPTRHSSRPGQGGYTLNFKEQQLMPSFPFRSFLCAAALAAVIPTHAGEMPRELKLLSQPKVAMLCTLQMTNLAILAQRDPVGAAHEAVQQSATFYTLALAWLPRAQAVSLEEQNRLGHLVVEQSVQDQMEQGEFCAEQAHQILDSLGPASKAAAVANGMSRAARLLRELQAG